MPSQRKAIAEWAGVSKLFGGKQMFEFEEHHAHYVFKGDEQRAV
jgi:hypothetical protein